MNENGSGAGMILRVLLMAPLAIGPAGCPSDQVPGENEVLMQSIAFEPKELTVEAGTTVTWRNVDFLPHTATSGNPDDLDFGSVFRSARLRLGQTFSHTFNEVGEFVYFCEVHPGMMRDAKVIVEGAAVP